MGHGLYAGSGGECDVNVVAARDSMDMMDWTPLHFASQQGHLKLVQLLFEHHADALVRNHEDRSFLDIA